MKLTEAILLESFGDLKRIMRAAFVDLAGDVKISGSNLGQVKRTNISLYNDYNELTKLLADAKRRGVNIPNVQITTADGLFEILRWVMKHQQTENTRPEARDTGMWIRLLRTSETGLGIHLIIMSLNNFIPDIVRYETDPNRQKADLETIRKTSKYEVYKLNNYMAARKVCNTFKTNFCIGADPSWFDNYGTSKDRETYAITLPNRTVIIVHSGNGGFLITDHANKADVSHTGYGRGTAGRGVAEDFKAAGLNEREAVEALMHAIPRRFQSNVQQIMQNAFNPSSSSVVYSSGGVKVEEIKKGYSIRVSSPRGEVYMILAGSGFILSDSPDFDMALRRDPDGTVRYLTSHLGLTNTIISNMIAAMYDYGGEPDRMAEKLAQTMLSAMR